MNTKTIETQYIQMLIQDAFLDAHQRKLFEPKKTWTSKIRHGSNAMHYAATIEPHHADFHIELSYLQENPKQKPTTYKIVQYNKNGRIAWTLNIDVTSENTIDAWKLTCRNTDDSTKKIYNHSKNDLYTALSESGVVNTILRVNKTHNVAYPSRDEYVLQQEIQQRIAKLLENGEGREIISEWDNHPKVFTHTKGQVKPQDEAYKHLTIEWSYFDRAQSKSIGLYIKTEGKVLWRVELTQYNDMPAIMLMEILYNKHYERVPSTEILKAFENLHGLDVLNSIDDLLDVKNNGTSLQDLTKTIKYQEEPMWKKAIREAKKSMQHHNGTVEPRVLDKDDSTLKAMFDLDHRPEWFSDVEKYYTAYTTRKDVLSNLYSDGLIQKDAYLDALRTAMTECMGHIAEHLGREQFTQHFGESYANAIMGNVSSEAIPKR